jgi:hypothetical protein
MAAKIQYATTASGMRYSLGKTSPSYASAVRKALKSGATKPTAHAAGLKAHRASMRSGLGGAARSGGGNG